MCVQTAVPVGHPWESANPLMGSRTTPLVSRRAPIMPLAWPPRVRVWPLFRDLGPQPREVRAKVAMAGSTAQPHTSSSTPTPHLSPLSCLILLPRRAPSGDCAHAGLPLATAVSSLPSIQEMLGKSLQVVRLPSGASATSPGS